MYSGEKKKIRIVLIHLRTHNKHGYREQSGNPRCQGGSIERQHLHSCRGLELGRVRDRIVNWEDTLFVAFETIRSLMLV